MRRRSYSALDRARAVRYTHLSVMTLNMQELASSTREARRADAAESLFRQQCRRPAPELEASEPALVRGVVAAG